MNLPVSTVYGVRRAFDAIRSPVMSTLLPSESGSYRVVRAAVG